MRYLYLAIGLVVALTASACKKAQQIASDIMPSNASKDRFVHQLTDLPKYGHAIIRGTHSDSPVQGEMMIYHVPDIGFRVLASVKGLTPNAKHGFHIHEKGSCADAGEAAGGHYDPQYTGRHGKPDEPHVHVGDLGNLVADAHGGVRYDRYILHDGLMQKPFVSFIDHAVIVHANEDVFTQPLGDAGARIGCGVIQKP